MYKMLLITLMMFTLSGCSTYSSSSGYSSTSDGNIRQSTSYYSLYDRIITLPMLMRSLIQTIIRAMGDTVDMGLIAMRPRINKAC